MPLTVKELIKELKQYPPDSKVAIAAFDHSEDEIDGLVNSVQDLEDGPDIHGPSAFKTHGAIPVIRG